MIGVLYRTGLTLAIAFNLCFAGPAAAQSPESLASAQRIMHDLLSAINLKALVMEGARKSATSMGSLNAYRPNWSEFMLQAMEEEVAGSAPLFERVMSRRIATQLTLEELRAGEVIMADPIVKASMAAAAQGQPEPASQACSRPCMRALNSRPGQSFMRRMERFDTLMGPEAIGDLMAALMPGFLRRAADKIEAAERAAGKP